MEDLLNKTSVKYDDKKKNVIFKETNKDAN